MNKKTLLTISLLLLLALGLSFLRTPPATRHLRDAQRFHEQGAVQAAENSYLLALSHDDNLGEAYLRLARLLFNDGRFVAAEANLRKAMGTQSHRAEAIVELAYLLRTQGRRAEIEELIARARHYQAEEAALQVSAQAAILEIFELFAQAERDAAEAGVSLKNASTVADIRLAADEIKDEAARHRLLGRAESILSLAKSHIATLGGTSNGRSRLLVAEMLGISGDATAAMVAADELSQSGDDIVAASSYMILASLSKEAGDVEKALMLLGSAYARDPGNIATGFQLRRLRLLSDGFDSAIFEIDPAGGFGGPPGAFETYKTGISHLLRKDYPSAATTLTRLVQSHPQWVPGLIALAVSHYHAGSHARALGELRVVERLVPEQIAVKAAIAYLLIEMNNLEEAREYASLVLESDPRNPAALEIIAQSFFLEGRFPEGMEALNRLIELSRKADPGLEYLTARYPVSASKPRDVFLNSNARGMIQTARGDLHAAEREFRSMPFIMTITDESLLRQLWWVTPLANLQQAQTQVRLGNTASARTILNASLARLKSLAQVDYSLAIGLIDRSGAAEPSRLTSEQTALSHGRMPAIAAVEMELGSIAMLEGEHAAAIAHGNNVIAGRPQDRRALLLLLNARAHLGKAHLARAAAELEHWFKLADGQPGVEAFSECAKLEMRERADESQALTASYARLQRHLRNAEAAHLEGAIHAKRLLDLDDSNIEARLAAAAIEELMTETWNIRRMFLERLVQEMHDAVNELRNTALQLRKEFLETMEELKVAANEPGEEAINRAEEISRDTESRRATLVELSHNMRHLTTQLVRLQTALAQAQSNAVTYARQAEELRQPASDGPCSDHGGSI